MKKNLRNNKGVTLVEVLAVLVLMSLVVVMINGVHMFGQKQFSSQKDQINHQENVQFAIKYMTREVRKHGHVKKDDPDDILTIIHDPDMSSSTGLDIYKVEDTILYKNDTPLVYGIEKINAEIDPENERKLYLEVHSVKDTKEKTVMAETEMYFRPREEVE